MLPEYLHWKYIHSIYVIEYGKTIVRLICSLRALGNKSKRVIIMLYFCMVGWHRVCSISRWWDCLWSFWMRSLGICIWGNVRISCCLLSIVYRLIGGIWWSTSKWQSTNHQHCSTNSATSSPPPPNLNPKSVKEISSSQ